MTDTDIRSQKKVFGRSTDLILSTGSTTTEWMSIGKPMYQELLQELQLGRMEGPFQAPDWWPRSTIDIEGYETKALEHSDIRCAFSFAVCQADKVRRCEDYRRSGHNSTVCTYDVPFHHGVQTYVEISKAFYELGEDSAVWCQDLSAAYRQFAVEQPSDCYSILCCPQGPLLLRHRALCFGASSSVWSFNRSADGVTYLARRMAQVPTGHYVDDFTACEPTRTITSGYTAFETIFKSLGLRMKPKKAQPPALSQKVLGVPNADGTRAGHSQPTPGAPPEDQNTDSRSPSLGLHDTRPSPTVSWQDSFLEHNAVRTDWSTNLAAFVWQGLWRFHQHGWPPQPWASLSAASSTHMAGGQRTQGHPLWSEGTSGCPLHWRLLRDGWPVFSDQQRSDPSEVVSQAGTTLHQRLGLRG